MTDDKPKTVRPLSPHLQVYRLPLLAVVSILNRVAGIALTGILVLLVVWLIALAQGGVFYANVAWFAGSIAGKLMMIAAAAGLGWHGANGIRHIAWDAGYGFDIPAAERSAYIVIAITILSALGMACLLFGGLLHG